ncbi:exopolyphosphatase [Salinicola aestuarinus]|uniref:exopolyphosphatase n=1 Tax=Salinicola aestuarinus TaxID=1949082 RepID=UPI000DA1FF58|nr:exopolyphosphatase [Salinicola aestuarinus]
MSGKSTAKEATRRLAAIDLGSNSFHLLVANYQDGRLQVVAKMGEKVQLAAGLDDDDNFTPDAMARALACLERFAPFLEDVADDDMRIVGTNALRAANNADDLIRRAQSSIGHAIEIIGGREEARLIYLGTAHALAEVHGRRLIVDIGGGSTELIIGEDFEPQALESLHMGCVAYTGRFFADGNITEKRFRRAEMAALSEIANIQRQYRRLGWQDPIGSSGTIKAAAAVIAANGDGDASVIERDALRKLRKRLIAFGQLDKVAMNGLKEDRARVFPAGVAILCAVFEAFDLERMRYSDGALREGVLFDLVGRDTPEDSRRHSVESMMTRYSVDIAQADNVARCALIAFDQLQKAWRLSDEQRLFLYWAAQLHEIGLAISHSQFHRHGAYLIEHSDLTGFSRPEQQSLAFLVRAHRRKFPQKESETPDNAKYCDDWRLVRLLRLAVCLHHSRPERGVDDARFRAEGESLHVELPPARRHPLMINDLEQEAVYQRAVGLTLTFDA